MKITFASALLLLAFTSISHAAPVGVSVNGLGNSAYDLTNKVTGTTNKVTATGNGEEAAGSIEAGGSQFSINRRLVAKVNNAVDGAKSVVSGVTNLGSTDTVDKVKDSASGEGATGSFEAGGSQFSINRRLVAKVNNAVGEAKSIVNGVTNLGSTDTVDQVKDSASGEGATGSIKTDSLSLPIGRRSGEVKNAVNKVASTVKGTA
ncbi:6800_t:CDS:1 [Ambispora gerdemannii]|uniref:6800_t:CDS:1 n=1 Tax=Ambispora gerdemannii TaxID=144530 RepID=A0A9N9CYW1_9GLOM|nr:6800_t:CDS:1 [Ambispora gerdemannii]